MSARSIETPADWIALVNQVWFTNLNGWYSVYAVEAQAPEGVMIIIDRIVPDRKTGEERQFAVAYRVIPGAVSERRALRHILWLVEQNLYHDAAECMIVRREDGTIERPFDPHA